MIFPSRPVRPVARRPRPGLRELRRTSLCPTLTEINWGETGDGRLAAIGTLRALSGGR